VASRRPRRRDVLTLSLHDPVDWKNAEIGRHPAAAALLGVDVSAVRTIALAIGGALVGLGGGAITVGYLGVYTDGGAT